MLTHVQVHIGRQMLKGFCHNIRVCTYPISSAFKGVGQKQGSEMTPLGMHRICQKIGGKHPVDAAFVGRQYTGENFSKLHKYDGSRDWILGRILWLQGMAPGVNCGERVGSKQRYIYIHGTPWSLDEPASHGCIRMACADVAELYTRVCVGTRVMITKDSYYV